jgi:hypothetical protein
LAPIPVVPKALMRSRKRTLRAAIGHSHEARLHDVAAQHTVETLTGITSTAEPFPRMCNSERRWRSNHGRQLIRADGRLIRCVDA